MIKVAHRVHLNTVLNVALAISALAMIATDYTMILLKENAHHAPATAQLVLCMLLVIVIAVKVAIN